MGDGIASIAPLRERNQPPDPTPIETRPKAPALRKTPIITTPYSANGLTQSHC